MLQRGLLGTEVGSHGPEVVPVPPDIKFAYIFHVAEKNLCGLGFLTADAWGFYQLA